MSEVKKNTPAKKKTSRRRKKKKKVQIADGKKALKAGINKIGVKNKWAAAVKNQDKKKRFKKEQSNIREMLKQKHAASARKQDLKKIAKKAEEEHNKSHAVEVHKMKVDETKFQEKETKAPVVAKKEEPPKEEPKEVEAAEQKKEEKKAAKEAKESTPQEEAAESVQTAPTPEKKKKKKKDGDTLESILYVLCSWKLI
jgi:hypothetical protein